jgi:hypothetical protein
LGSAACGAPEWSPVLRGGNHREQERAVGAGSCCMRRLIAWRVRGTGTTPLSWKASAAPAVARRTIAALCILGFRRPMRVHEIR